MVPDLFDALRLPIVPIEPRPAFAAALLRQIRGKAAVVANQPATVRYFVADLDRAVEFYCHRLDFEVELRPSPAFAMLYRGDLRLLLSVPGGSHILPDGTVPEPGGWNRISLQVADLATAVEALREAGAHVRADIARSAAVQNALIEDPSGNPIELFEPIAGYHERAPSSTR
jgi:catechol 2,3-dioxygenase-like lactoylglutathione lyase family enzyme